MKFCLFLGSSSYCFLVALLLCFLPSSRSCGVSTHYAVAERASSWFDSHAYPEYAEILKTELEWFQPGTYFPDWGYPCSFPSEAEEAHWPAFHNLTTWYLHDRYPKPWDEKTRKLVAFVFGLFSHGVSDVPWHSMEISEGLIQFIEFAELDGDYNSAHSIADVGAEFVLSRTQQLAGRAQRRWKVPASDLVELYKIRFQQQTDVTEEHVERCMALGFAATWANQILGDLALPYVRDSPFLLEEYESYFLGGLDDMAAWTATCWEDLARWLDSGEGSRPMCTLMENKWEDQGLKEPRTGRLQGPEALEFLRKAGYEVVSSRVDGVVALELIRPDGADPLDPSLALPEGKQKAAAPSESEETTPHNNNNNNNNNDSDDDRCVTPDQLGQPSRTFQTNTTFSQFGYSLTTGDFNADGIEDLAVGAPSYSELGKPLLGAVYLLYGKKAEAAPTGNRAPEDVMLAADLTLLGDRPFSRFGFSLVAVDLNGDGVQDLAVSAPTYNGDQLFYDGRVYVYTGSAAGIAPGSLLATIKTDQPHPEFDPSKPHPFKYVVMGSKLQAADFDDDGRPDLIINSPMAAPHGEGQQVGMVSVFLSSSRHRGQLDLYADADLELSGKGDYGRFGSDTQLVRLASGANLVLVGANYRQTSKATAAAGRLYGFEASNPSRPLFTLDGVLRHQKFGSSLAVGDFYGDNRTLVAVSAMSEDVEGAWQAGVLRVFDLEGLRGHHRLSDLTPLATIQGSQPAAHFSWDLTLAAGSLWVSEPLYGTLQLNSLSTGRILEFPLGSSFPRGLVTDHVASARTCIVGAETRGRFGFDSQFLDFNGDGLRDMVVSQPSSSLGAYHSGAVTVFYGSEASALFQ